MVRDSPPNKDPKTTGLLLLNPIRIIGIMIPVNKHNRTNL
jgi:hypothetical protein